MRKLFLIALAVSSVVACGGPGRDTAQPSAQAGTSSPVASTAASTTPLVVKDFTLDPKDVSVQGVVSLDVTNQGPTVHNVTIRDASGNVLGATKDLKTGQSETLTADLPTGSYILFCSLPGHESLGITGTLTVRR